MSNLAGFERYMLCPGPSESFDATLYPTCFGPHLSRCRRQPEPRHPGPGSRFSSEIEQTAQVRKEAIASEARLGQDPDWAGEYYEGDGTGVNVSLALAPKSGFVFEWQGCLGFYDRNLGSIEVSGNRIALRPAFPNERRGFQGIATEFYSIRWGERRYLVPTGEVQDFCNDINAGVEPRNEAHGHHLLKRGDEEKPTSDEPTFPDSVLDCVLAKPIEAKVVAVGEHRLRRSAADFKLRETEATLSVGRNQGVAQGMELFLRSRRRYASAKVVDLADDTSTILFVQFEEDPTPEIGWRMSTQLHPRMGMLELLFD
jgi:hypothetical protein